MYAAGQPTRDELMRAVEADFVTLRGTYLHVDGDRFVYECGGGSLCSDVLVRDEYLKAHVVELDGKPISIVVRREVCSMV